MVATSPRIEYTKDNSRLSQKEPQEQTENFVARQTESKISFQGPYILVHKSTHSHAAHTDAHTIYGKTDVFGFIYFQSGLGDSDRGSACCLLCHRITKIISKDPAHIHMHAYLGNGKARNHIRQQHKDQKQEQQEHQNQYQYEWEYEYQWQTWKQIPLHIFRKWENAKVLLRSVRQCAGWNGGGPEPRRKAAN